MKRLLCMAAAAMVASIAAANGTAIAQRRPCVEDTTPPPTAGEQAECWFGRHDYAQAAGWCEHADLSDEAAGNLCLSSYVRAGRFEDAARIAGTLERVRPAVRPCHAAFTTGLRVRIVPNPTSGVVTVDGEAYSRGDAEVLLSPPFWDHRVSVSFAGRRVAVSAQRLRRALDLETCAARDVVVEERSGTSSGGGPPTPTIALGVGAGVAAIVGSVLLAVAELSASDLAASDNTTWDQDQADEVSRFRLVGTISLVTGGVALGVAVVLWMTAGNDGDASTERGAAARREGAVLRW